MYHMPIQTPEELTRSSEAPTAAELSDVYLPTAEVSIAIGESSHSMAQLQQNRCS